MLLHTGIGLHTLFQNVHLSLILTMNFSGALENISLLLPVLLYVILIIAYWHIDGFWTHHKKFSASFFSSHNNKFSKQISGRMKTFQIF